MANLIYSVEKVFRSYLTNNHIYNIPEYQRGHKWNEENVKLVLANGSALVYDMNIQNKFSKFKMEIIK